MRAAGPLRTLALPPTLLSLSRAACALAVLLTGHSATHELLKRVKVHVVSKATLLERAQGCKIHDSGSMLMVSVRRYGQHWHVFMDSFAFTWKLLRDRGELVGHNKATKPTVVIMNTRQRTKDPYSRGVCCVKPSNRSEADLGPWQPVWDTISKHTTLSPDWLFKGPRRCVSKVRSNQPAQQPARPPAKCTKRRCVQTPASHSRSQTSNDWNYPAQRAVCPCDVVAAKAAL